MSELISRYRKAQVKAAVKVNSEKLLWNWQMGRDLVQRKAEECWGSGIVEQVSLDLQAAFPGDKGFGSASLWAMKRWVLFYTQNQGLKKLERVVQEMNISQNPMSNILHQLGAEIHNDQEQEAFPTIFAYVPWGHHIEIIKNASQ